MHLQDYKTSVLVALGYRDSTLHTNHVCVVVFFFKTDEIVRCPLSLGPHSPAIRIYLQATRAPVPILASPPLQGANPVSPSSQVRSSFPFRNDWRGKRTRGAKDEASRPVIHPPPPTRLSPPHAAGAQPRGRKPRPGPPRRRLILAQFPRPRDRGSPRRGSPGAGGGAAPTSGTRGCREGQGGGRPGSR